MIIFLRFSDAFGGLDRDFWILFNVFGGLNSKFYMFLVVAFFG